MLCGGEEGGGKNKTKQKPTYLSVAPLVGGWGVGGGLTQNPLTKVSRFC